MSEDAVRNKGEVLRIPCPIMLQDTNRGMVAAKKYFLNS